MRCGTNFSEFSAHDWWSWSYRNATTIYCDYNFDLCHATFDGVADIDGWGVAMSFIIQAWITIIVAVCNAYYPIRDSCYQILHAWSHLKKGEPQPEPNGQTDSTPELPHRRWELLEPVTDCFLQSICDVQVVTGTAVLAAGFAQGSHLTFFHGQLISTYWYLTLNAYWAARSKQYGEVERSLTWTYVRRQLRTTAVLITVACSIAFQSFINIREQYYWDPFQPGRCYLFQDHSAWWSSWLWTAGLILYAIALIFALFDSGRQRVSAVLGCCSALNIALWKPLHKHLDEVRRKVRALPNSSSSRWVTVYPSLALNVACSAAVVVALVICWCVVEFLAIWSFGEASSFVQIAAYIAIAAWNTWDITSLKSSNKPLLQVKEETWGFGQVLPLVLLATLVFALVDALKAVLERQATDRKSCAYQMSTLAAQANTDIEAQSNVEAETDGAQSRQ